MTSLRLAAPLAALLLIAPAPARADAVLDWNEVGLATVQAARQPPPDGARTLAMMHVAIFDAVNAVEKRYAPFGVKLDAPAGASANAAAAAAARTVLLKLFPDQREVVEKAYTASLQRIAQEGGIEAGIAVGEKAGGACLETRADDGVGAANLYRPVTSAGVYVPTALPA